ncbi:LOW QUALITY PROTEIN: G2/M phase-specific E3 ubiquitin-protein ligase-like [Falco peregrinus]|uniref:LOW QUALITY PROTEIN: G2/M phase-specific E3 ubiquitin-protein ligase-like n=1 Tax=Falco peregrinus TaxID=8954 RepID=UPI0024787E43|nr:LOW QUALITY PROTEIN: G2/M phase-specific E3 ubiquitin-protein ligase-like [Falco peregrinus]
MDVCGLCQRADCGPDIVGELRQKRELCVHEKCLFHASRLRQRGADQHGFYGFLKSRDVRRVMKRTAQKRCCICQLLGDSISCRGWRCRRTFHLPCGSERGCVSQFRNSWMRCKGLLQECEDVSRKDSEGLDIERWRVATGPALTDLRSRHRDTPRSLTTQCPTAWPEQGARPSLRPPCSKGGVRPQGGQGHNVLRPLPHPTCRDEVAGRPCYTTMVCPSRASAWFHRRCIQGQALRSGLHHFRSPLCRDMTAFQAEMFRLGIKIPDRDAAWEEEGSLLDLVLWQSSCDADQCLCPLGRDQAEQAGPWRLLVCSSCGSRGTRQCCSALEDATESWECRDCSGTHSGEGGSGRTGCPGRGGSHSHWGLGDRRCDAWREGAWQGLVVLIISLPPAVPDIAAGPDSGPPGAGTLAQRSQ